MIRFEAIYQTPALSARGVHVAEMFRLSSGGFYNVLSMPCYMIECSNISNNGLPRWSI